MAYLYHSLLRALTRRTRAQGMVEYGIILALIAVVVIAAVTLIGSQIKTAFESIIAAL